MAFKNKKIILAISGSIAAYKTPELVRQLVKLGAQVKIVCTEGALQFVSSLSLSTVSKNEVWTQLNDQQKWNNHVALGRWADLMLIAPCSANTLAKLAYGLCDNALCAVYLSACCPVFIAPAMDEDMWQHPSTQKNLKTVLEHGNHYIEVGHGELVSGLVGAGRMAEIETIIERLRLFLEVEQNCLGKKVLVNAGPTYEKLDPVRFIGNYSSGKMGAAIALELANRGAEVDLVLGPSALHISHPNIKLTRVESADEMYQACNHKFEQVDIAILAAAVADYKPKDKAAHKIKKKETTFELELVKNIDILASLGKVKTSKQILVGFALESQNALENAQEKLQKKNADYIVLNSLEDAGKIFGADQNKITILSKNALPKSFPIATKQECAKQIVDFITEEKP